MSHHRVRSLALRNVPTLILLVMFLLFSAIEPRFFDAETLTNVARQASYIGIMAVGMTLVLMTAGIDLSVGSLMYLSAVLVSEVISQVALPVIAVPLLALTIGILLGAINGFGVTFLRVVPFVVTLATLTVFRGYGLSLSRSREVNYPDIIASIGSQTVLGVPVPVLVFALVALVAHLVVTRTPFGRQLLATGEDPKAAAKAGVPVRRILFSVYAISGALAGLAGFVALTQLGTAAPSFGTADEFDAIAAAVLGGTSLFGGRGSVFPGTVVGSLLVQLIAAGLVFMRVDLYVTPMVTAGIILLAVLVDAIRTRRIASMSGRTVTSARISTT